MRYRLHKLIAASIGSRQIEELDRGPTWLDEELQVEYIRGKLIFTRTADRVLLEGTLASATTVQCGRSLELFVLPLTVPLDDVELVIHGVMLPATEDISDKPKIDKEYWVDLTETIREAIITSIPINPVSPKYLESTALAGLVANQLGDEDSDWLTIRWANEDHDQVN